MRTYFSDVLLKTRLVPKIYKSFAEMKAIPV
jgi:hypothetical protein